MSLAALGSQFTGGKLGTMPAGRIEITREVIRGDTAEVEATFHYADGTVEPMGTNTLVMENGQWKIALDLFGTGLGSPGSSPTPGASSTSQAARQTAGSPPPGTSAASPNLSTQPGSQAPQTPGDVARQFFVLTSRGEYEAAAALMTDEAKMLFMFGAFLTTGLSGLAGEETGSKSIAQVEITREAVQGDAAEVECTLHYSDGSVDPVGSVALARVSGQWKITADAPGSIGQPLDEPSPPGATSSRPSAAPQPVGSSLAGPGVSVPSAALPPFIVAIDAGHGGSDSGAVSGGLTEKTINLAIVKRVVALLAADPQIRPVTTRTVDVRIPNEDRIRIAEEAGASMYISIHVNSFTQSDVSGVETWVDTTRKDSDATWTLAAMMQEALSTATGARNRGIRTQESYLQRTTMPAVTLEVGYITNPEERMRLVDPAYQDKVAAGIVAGLRQFLQWRAANPSAAAPASANTTLADTRAAGAGLPEGAVARLGLGTPSSMQYSPDGRWIAVATSMGVEMRRSDTLALEKLLGGHAATTVAFSTDGRTLASGSEDAAIRVWDATTGQLLLTLSGHTQEVSSIAFSPDGSTIASGSWDKTIKLWDSATGSVLHTLSGHAAAVRTVVFSSDGKVLASGSLDKTISLWATGSGTLIRSLSAFFGSPVIFSPDGKILVSKSPDGIVMMWDAATGTLVRNLEGRTNDACSIAFSPSGALIASGAGETVKLWDVITGTLLRTLAGHTSSVWIVTFSPDGRTLASGCLDRTIRLWDAVTGALMHTITSPTGNIGPVGFSPDGKKIASSSEDGSIGLWDVGTGGLLQTAAGYTDGVWSVAFSPDGKTIASGSYDKTLSLWDASTGRLLSTLAGHAGLVHSVAFSPDGKLLVSGSYDNTIKVWDAATSTLLRTLSGNTAQVLSVAFSPDGRTLASATYDGTVRVWDVGAGTLLRTFLETQLAGSTYSVAFSPDGRILASGAQYLGITLWDTVTWAVLRTVPQEGANYHAIAFSPDGKTLASGGTQTILDVATGSALCTFFGHTDIVFCVAFSPDGKTLASASADCTVKLWDAATGALLRTLLGHTLRVDSVAFSPDGRALASGSHDGTILLWDIDAVIGN
jgi:WD40 repeat protein/N-acetylmuramoyl-L-alanine amidase